MFDKEFEEEFYKKIRKELTKIIREKRARRILVVNSDKIKCIHEFIPMFNTVCCKYCGIDKDKVK